MLKIDSISKGIVIDHIKTGYGYEIFKLLELDKASYAVALIMNVDSKKLGKKDIIKVENKIDVDLAILGLIDKNLTVNIIENGNIKEKISMVLPETVKGFIKCKNPRCITCHENIETHFVLLKREEGIYRCNYCDNLYTAGK
ncbi:aspartate carbamoyltransferase regulatory subunit [Actinomyces sp. zg-332]|uniref:aspartate carbamoyltransferase regulatory subunit n=1 Tax=Actinomyces sp. zg-332 TaxID=2708340 RepID=UPI0014243B43|nr:aspartate carbamoyltransferase regulatory subunit [Actinomyces sp. zg-332]QPK93705.1 aspartate carbamoyltransferase regulatory subunit [Actinomyces sp. zg-332]